MGKNADPPVRSNETGLQHPLDYEYALCEHEECNKFHPTRFVKAGVCQSKLFDLEIKQKKFVEENLKRGLLPVIIASLFGAILIFMGPFLQSGMQQQLSVMLLGFSVVVFSSYWYSKKMKRRKRRLEDQFISQHPELNEMQTKLREY